MICFDNDWLAAERYADEWSGWSYDTTWTAKVGR
jgi:hypothetical protein